MVQPPRALSHGNYNPTMNGRYFDDDIKMTQSRWVTNIPCMMVMKGISMHKAEHGFKVIKVPAYGTHHILDGVVSDKVKPSQLRNYLNDNNGRALNHSKLFLLLAQLKWGAEYRPTILWFVFSREGGGGIKTNARSHDTTLSVTQRRKSISIKTPQLTPCQRMILRLTIL